MSTHAVSERITTGLHKLVAEGHRVIWWADPQAEFHEAVAELSLDGAELIPLAVKRRVELDGDRGRERLSPSPPSEPCMRFSRTRLPSWSFPHRECLACR